eukprot:7479581-Pyramimonas_sp.AAC.1
MLVSTKACLPAPQPARAHCAIPERFPSPPPNTFDTVAEGGGGSDSPSRRLRVQPIKQNSQAGQKHELPQFAVMSWVGAGPPAPGAPGAPRA